MKALTLCVTNGRSMEKKALIFFLFEIITEIFLFGQRKRTGNVYFKTFLRFIGSSHIFIRR